MANRFTDSFNGQQYYQPQQNGNLFSKWSECQSNPAQFLANNNINVPEQYRSSPEMTAKYLLGNLNGQQQNLVMQKVNMFKAMFGLR